MDKETLEIQREGQMIEDFTKTEGWTWIKDRLSETIIDLQSIRNINDALSPEEVVLDIKARNTAVEILMNVIKNVEGRASQHSNNKQVTVTHEEILYYEK